MAERDLRAAKRYAAALFGAAQKEQKLDAIERDLKTVGDAMAQVPLLLQMWESPRIPSGRKRDLILKTFGEEVDPLTVSFLRLLVDKRREDLLEAVQEEMGQLADAARHLVRAEATFAVAPTEKEVTDLKVSLEKMTGAEVLLTPKVDEAILGGVVVRLRDTILDGSVRGTLERLREQLLQES